MRLCILLLGLTSAGWLCTAQEPKFEVVSIRPNNSESLNGGLGPRGSRLVGVNVTLKTLLGYAYRPSSGGFLDAQIVNEPGWAKTDRFDIEAKAPDDAQVVPGERTRAMVRSMLEDSFQLKVHRETRELPVYNLVALKHGPKLSADQTPVGPRQAMISFVSEGSAAGPLARGGLRMTAGPDKNTLTGTAVSIAQIVTMLQPQSDRMILDKTGLPGLIDVDVEFRKDLTGNATDAAPSLFTAIREIGLKLESVKAPIDVLVVDHVERPAGH